MCGKGQIKSRANQLILAYLSVGVLECSVSAFLMGTSRSTSGNLNGHGKGMFRSNSMVQHGSLGLLGTDMFHSQSGCFAIANYLKCPFDCADGHWDQLCP